jgi:hypothetical protein
MRMMAAIAIGADCISIGIVFKSIAICLDCVSMDVNSGFNGGFNGGFDGCFDGQFHLAVLGYQPQRSIRQLSREAFMAINQEGVTACH